jgi:hypothetical protein
VWMVGGWKFLGILSDDFGISSVVTLSVTYLVGLSIKVEYS